MTNIDPILQKMRLMESTRLQLLLEISQGMDDFKNQVRAAYAKQGINLSDKAIEMFIEVYGLDAPATPEAAKRVKNIMKNPSRFIENLKKISGDNSQKMAQKVAAKGNAADNPTIVDALVQVLTQIEKNTSMTASQLATVSSDVYGMLKQVENWKNQQQDKLSPKLLEVLNKILQQLKQSADAIKSNKHPLYGKDMTGEEVEVKEEGEPEKQGTVVLDYDDKGLTQEGIDMVARTSQEQGISFNPPTLEGLKQQPNHAWVLIPRDKKIINVDKAKLDFVGFKLAMSTINMQEPELYQIIGQIQDETSRQLMAKTLTGIENVRGKLARGWNKMGYDYEKLRRIRTGEGEKNIVRVPITGGRYDSSALKLLSFISSNHLGELQITQEEVKLYGRMVQMVFSSPQMTIDFVSAPPKLSAIDKIVIKSIKPGIVDDLKKFMQKERVQANVSVENNNLVLSNIRY